jgi:hypothetical protein
MPISRIVGAVFGGWVTTMEPTDRVLMLLAMAGLVGLVSTVAYFFLIAR